MRYTSLGERISATRRELGLRQADLANAAGVSEAAVSQWERDETKNLRLEHLFAVADLMKVNPRWLALEQGPKFLKVAMLTLLVLPPLLIDSIRYAVCVLCKKASEESPYHSTLSLIFRKPCGTATS